MKGGSKKANSIDLDESADEMPDLVDPDEDDSSSAMNSSRGHSSGGKDMYWSKKSRALVTNAPEAARAWFGMPVNDREQHYQVIRVRLMAPFLFAHVFQPDKWLLWAKDVGLLKERRLEIGGLSEDELQVVDVIGAAAESLEGDVKNAFMLEELLTLMDKVESFRLVKTGVAPTRENVWVSLATKKLTEKFSKLSPGILHAAVLFATRQYTEHIRKLMFEGTDVKEEFLNTCQEGEARSSTLKDKGNQYFNEGNYEAAISSYQQAIYLNPFNHILYSNRAFSYLKTGRMRLALADAKRCVVLRVDWEKGQYRYAQALFELGYYEKALEANLNGQRRCKAHCDLDRQYQNFTESRGKSKSRPAPSTTAKNKSVQNSVSEKRVFQLHDDEDVPDLVSDLDMNTDEDSFSSSSSGSCDVLDKGSTLSRTTASDDDGLPDLVDEDVDSDVGDRYSDDNMNTDKIVDKKDKNKMPGADADASLDLPDLISETDSSDSDIDDPPNKSSSKPSTTTTSANHSFDSERIRAAKEKDKEKDRDRLIQSESRKREADRRCFEEDKAELRRQKRERREQKRRRNEQIQAAPVAQSSANSERLAVQAQLAQGTQQMLSGQWRNATHQFIQGLNAAHGKDTLTQQEMVILLYAIARANIEHGEHNAILEGLGHLENIKSFPNVVFPLVYHGLAAAQCKQNNYYEALVPIDEGLNALQRCGGQSATCFWPGTETVIEESRAEKMAEVFREMRAMCLNPPKPDAICRYLDCRSRVQIYLSDLDFKGYVRVVCSDMCHIDYHPTCWRRVRSLHPSKPGEKDMLTETCLTPDCPGLLVSISIIDELGKVKKAFNADESELATKLSALKPAPAVATAAPTVKKKTKVTGGKKRERREKDDDEVVATQIYGAGGVGKSRAAKSEDIDVNKVKVSASKAAPTPVATENALKNDDSDASKSRPAKTPQQPQVVSLSGAPGLSTNHSTTVELPTYSSQTSYSSATEDVSLGTAAAPQLEEAKMVVLKRDDVEELIAPQAKSRAKAKKKKVKGKVKLDLFLGTQSHSQPDGTVVVEDDALSIASNGPITPVEQARPSAPPLTFAMSLPGAKSSSEFPHLGHINDGDAESVSPAATSATESVTQNESNVLDNTYSFFAEILRYEGPVDINDSRLQQPLTTIIPDSTRQQVEEMGGLRVFLQLSNQFAFQGNMVCLKENAASLENGNDPWGKRPALNADANEFVPRTGPLTMSTDDEGWSENADNVTPDPDVLPSVQPPMPIPMIPAYPLPHFGMPPFANMGMPSYMHPPPGMCPNVPAAGPPPSDMSPVLNNISAQSSPPVARRGSVHERSEVVMCDNHPADVGVKMAEEILSSSPVSNLSSRKSSEYVHEVEDMKLLKSIKPTHQAGLLIGGQQPAQRNDSISSTIESYSVNASVQTPASFDVFHAQCEVLQEENQLLRQQMSDASDRQVQQKKRFELELDRALKVAEQTQKLFDDRKAELSKLQGRHEVDQQQMAELKRESKEKLRTLRERVKEAEAKEERMHREMEQRTESLQRQVAQTHREHEEYTKQVSAEIHNLETALQQAKQRARLAELQVIDLQRDQPLREVDAYIQQSNVSLAYIQRALSSGHSNPQILEQQHQWQMYLQDLNRCAEALRSKAADMHRAIENGKELASLPRLNVALPPRPRFSQSARPAVPTGGMAPSVLPPGGAPPAAVPGMPGHMRPPAPTGQVPSVTSESERRPSPSVTPVVQPDTSHVQPGRESKSKNSFQKIMERLTEMFPHSSSQELTAYIKQVRAENNNSLSGISLEEIIRRVAVIVQKKGVQQQRVPPVVRSGVSLKMRHVPVSGGLPTRTAQSANSLTPVDMDNEDCIICHEEMTAETSTHLECRHRFHTECIRKWFMEQSTCPTCRVHSLMPDEYPALS